MADYYGPADQRALYYKNMGMADPDAMPEPSMGSAGGAGMFAPQPQSSYQAVDFGNGNAGTPSGFAMQQPQNSFGASREVLRGQIGDPMAALQGGRQMNFGNRAAVTDGGRDANGPVGTIGGTAWQGIPQSASPQGQTGAGYGPWNSNGNGGGWQTAPASSNTIQGQMGMASRMEVNRGQQQNQMMAQGGPTQNYRSGLAQSRPPMQSSYGQNMGMGGGMRQQGGGQFGGGMGMQRPQPRQQQGMGQYRQGGGGGWNGPQRPQRPVSQQNSFSGSSSGSSFGSGGMGSGMSEPKPAISAPQGNSFGGGGRRNGGGGWA